LLILPHFPLEWGNAGISCWWYHVGTGSDGYWHSTHWEMEATRRSSAVLFSQAPVCWLWCNLKRKGTRVDFNVVCMEQDIVDHCVGLRLEVDWVVAEKMHF
jgi:hypothetical protein